MDESTDRLGRWNDRFPSRPDSLTLNVETNELKKVSKLGQASLDSTRPPKICIPMIVKTSQKITNKAWGRTDGGRDVG